MVDRDDDIRIGIKTSALFFGRFDVIAVATSYALFLGLMAGIGAWQELGVLYYVGLALASVLAVHHITLIRGRDRMKCFAAFRGNNLLGMCVFTGLAADYLVRLKAWPQWS